MTDYYIFRHGDTRDSGNLLLRFYNFRGDSRDLPILPKALPALEGIGKYLKNIPTDADFCSPYLRCMDSAKIVGAIAGKKYTPDERIREYHVGKERFSSLFRRVSDFLDEIAKKDYPAVSICSHGALIAAIKHIKITGRFFFLQALDYPNPGNLIIIKDDKVEKINFNR